MDVDLQSVDINQCASGPGWYSNTHLCDLNSTQVRIQRVSYLPSPFQSCHQEQLTKAHQPLRASGKSLLMRQIEVRYQAI